MFIPATFLLPQFFQGVKGYAADKAGSQMIPFSIAIAATGFTGMSTCHSSHTCSGMLGKFSTDEPVGQFAGKVPDVRRLIWSGYTVQIVAYSLFALFLTPWVAMYRHHILTAIMAAGLGLALSPTMLVIQASVPHEDMAAATSGWVMVRSIGPSVGLALFNALLDTQVRYRFAQIEGYGTVFEEPHGSADYAKLHRLAQPLKSRVLTAFADSFKVSDSNELHDTVRDADEQICWVVGAGLMAFALFLTLTTATRPLGDGVGKVDGDEEEVVAPDVAAEPSYGAVGVAVRPSS